MSSLRAWPMFRGTWLGGVAFVALSVTAPAPAFAEPVSEATMRAKQADDHFLKGKAHLRRGDVKRAYAEYKAAWELKRSYDIAANLGNLELSMGMPRDAAEHLAFSVRTYGVSGTTAGQLARVKALLEVARQLVGALKVTVNVDGAEILIDGVSVGRTPIAEEIFVDPGHRVIEAHLGSYKPVHAAIDVERAASESVMLTLLPEAPPPMPAPVPPPAPMPPPPTPDAPVLPAPPDHRSRVPLGIGIALAAAGAGLGVAGFVVAQSKATTISALKADLLPLGYGACLRTPTPSQCAPLDSAYIDHGSFRNLAIAGFSGAGAFALATLVYATWPSAKPSASVAYRAWLSPSPGGASFTVSGGF